MLSHKMDFNCCANRDGFRRDSHNFSLYESMAGFRRAGHICMYVKIILNEAHIILHI